MRTPSPIQRQLATFGCSARPVLSVRLAATVRALCTALLLAASVTGCDGDDSLSLLAELRTDYVPGIEFVTVQTMLSASDDRVLATVHEDFAPGRDGLAGLRIAELSVPGAGTYRLEVTLLGLGGVVVARRPVTVGVTESLGWRLS
jgi:hypothetical protein